MRCAVRPGLIEPAGNSKTNCIYVGGSEESNINSVEALGVSGTDVQPCIETFDDADPTWADWVDPWITDEGRMDSSQWVEASAQSPDHRHCKALVPDAVIDADPNGWEASCASGAYDSYDQEYAQRLISDWLRLNAVIRLPATR